MAPHTKRGMGVELHSSYFKACFFSQEKIFQYVILVIKVLMIYNCWLHGDFKIHYCLDIVGLAYDPSYSIYVMFVSYGLKTTFL